MQSRNSVIFSDIDGELFQSGAASNIEQLKKYYLIFSQVKKYPDSYNAVEQSFENFKRSTAYAKLSTTDKSKLETNPPSNVIVLKFNTLEEAKECLVGMEQKGILKQGSANKLFEKLKELEEQQTHASRPQRR